MGEILDLQLPNIVRISLFAETTENITQVDLEKCCDLNNLISLLASSREQLDYNIWKIVGNKPVNILKKDFPNEIFRKKDWIGSKHYDAALIEDFMNSYYALLPWDDWYDPNYLDQFLINIHKKPENLIYKKNKPN